MAVLFLVRSFFLEIVNVFFNSVIDTYLSLDVTLVLTTPIPLPFAQLQHDLHYRIFVMCLH